MFAVPLELREHAPEGAAVAELCPRCLRVSARERAETDEADGPSTAPEFSAVVEEFPTDESGVALALALGKLDALALERAALLELLERVERAGDDPLLTLDRMLAAGSVRPHFDLERRRVQLEQLL